VTDQFGEVGLEQGQATVESIFLLPLVLSMIFAIAVSLWLGWQRFELSQLVQSLGACFESITSSSICRRHFGNAVARLPARWQVLNIRESDRFVEVDLAWKGLGPFWHRSQNAESSEELLRWKIEEPKPWKPR
jgi:hypothetical protein